MRVSLIHVVLLSHVAATLSMTGLIWFVQIVHYPLMSSIRIEDFANYERRHMSLTTWVVAPPMLIEAATAILLLWLRPAGISVWIVWFGGGLLAVIWLSTIFLQAPYHDSLANGFDAAIHQRLVSTNWIRTVAWSLRASLLLFILWSVSKVT